jgi:hypothetical protein
MMSTDDAQTLPPAPFPVTIVGVKRLLAGVALLSPLLAVALALFDARAALAAAQRVSVQPLDGPVGQSLRQQIARMVRRHGYRVVTSIPRVDGTGQYLTLARDHGLAAFVAADLEERKTRHTITLLVWDGANGSVLGRWSASAPPRRLPRALARGFWKHLGPALEKAQAPPSDELPPAPTMHIDASNNLDR